MAIRSLRILVRIDFPSATVRLWDGGGPYLDADGEVWRGARLIGLDRLEAALNAEASTIQAGLSAVQRAVGDQSWEELEAGDVVGSTVQVLIQPCDANDQPVGAPEVHFTARIDNLPFEEQVQGGVAVASIIAECVNRFTLRNMVSGSVLSDVDQKARAARLNPTGTPDRFCERIPLLADHTIAWPNL